MRFFLWLHPDNFGFRILNQSGRDNQIKIIKMKNLIPIISVAIASASLQNCANRDEDATTDFIQSEQLDKAFMKSADSANSSEETLYPDPDPPVRDGDNWRLIPRK